MERLMSAENLVTGQHFGDYVIEELLGQGGMAQVYKAVDPNLDRRVAIKVINPGVAEDPEYTKRFKREAQAVAKLNHPNIVSVFQFGVVENTYFMAMTFIDGVDVEWLIKDYLNDNRLLSSTDTLRILSQIASALDYAHGQGVIHRDVKPSNMLVNKQGRAFLTDFGLVRDMAIPTLGEIFGSPEYISPEQAINSAYAVPQSDLYSLGVVLFQMLTGSLPFSGGHPNDIAMRHIEEAPPSPRAFNPDISPEVEAVVMRTLEKKPEQRFQSGAEFFNALRLVIKASAGS
jgi:serine/threonine protein kinase